MRTSTDAKRSCGAAASTSAICGQAHPVASASLATRTSIDARFRPITCVGATTVWFCNSATQSCQSANNSTNQLWLGPACHLRRLGHASALQRPVPAMTCMYLCAGMAYDRRAALRRGLAVRARCHEHETAAYKVEPYQLRIPRCHSMTQVPGLSAASCPRGLGPQCEENEAEQELVHTHTSLRSEWRRSLCGGCTELSCTPMASLMT